MYINIDILLIILIQTQQVFCHKKCLFEDSYINRMRSSYSITKLYLSAYR
jgi:hypothetical protein